MNFTKLIPKRKSDWIIVVLIGVLLMIVAIPTGSSRKEKTEEQQQETVVMEQTMLSPEEYTAYLEKKLGTLLAKIQGVGKVEVMITLCDEGEAVLNKDVKRDEKKYEESTTILDADGREEIYVTKRIYPSVEGVAVAAEGAGQPSVRTEILDTVMALFPVELHKVKVTARSS